MNYRVVWRRRLRNALHNAAFYAYEKGRDADALRQAAADIELALSDNPAELGESREGAERVVIISPLSVTYEVFETSQAVMIYEVIYHPRQRL
jgi:hypothetical protein